MGKTTEILWCDHTFNPWWGCTKISEGCANCYADSFSNRLGLKIWGADADRRFFGDAHWEEPLKWDRAARKAGIRRKVFCGSMCDVMEDHGDLQHSRVRLYNLIDDTPNLDWLLLTKRPQNFRRFLPATWLERTRPNVWGMTTVESAEYLWRVTALLSTPFVLRGLSMEPLLGPVDLTRVGSGTRPDGSVGKNVLQAVERGTAMQHLDWVIVGGESGHGARPMSPAWAQSLRDQCVAARVAFFFKQWGEHLGAGQDGAFIDGTQVMNASDEPERVGKLAAGCLLDGQEWKQFPMAAVTNGK